MQTATTHSVLIVEDDAETRGHFALAIAAHPRLHLLAAVGTCAEGRAQLQHAPAVLLTDLELPDDHGINLIRDARRQSPETQILVSSMFGDEDTVIASVRAGASGYLLKDGTAEQIAAAVIELIDGGSPLSAGVARYVLRMVQTQPVTTPSNAAPARGERKGELPSLTEREVGVLELLAKGFSSTEIGELLSISRHTVITHSRSIHRKLEVSSRSEAIYEALSLGLIRLRE